MFLCVSETYRSNLVHGALIETETLTSPLCHVFAQFVPVLGTGTLPAGVSTPVKWSRNAPMCLRNFQKVFVAGDPNRSWDIDLPTPECICSMWLGFWVLVLYPQVCQHLPSSLEMFLSFPGISKKFGAWGPNGSWHIDLPTPKCICSTWPGFWAPPLCHQVCQQLWSSPEMFLCVSGTSYMYLVHGALIEAEILTSLFPMYLLNVACFFGFWWYTHGCQHLPSSLQMFLCVSRISKNI